MTTYALRIWYRATPEDAKPQTESGLTAEQAEMGVGSFLRDMLRLEGQGVRRFCVEIEEERS